MTSEILMPALSPTMEEGTLAKWLVKEGDSVSAGDILAEIETDKATMEFEAVDEGIIGKILVSEGSEGIKVNSPIAILIEDGEKISEKEILEASHQDVVSADTNTVEPKSRPATTELVMETEWTDATKVKEQTVREALRDAMAEELRRDENVFLMGEEVAEYQGAYKVSQGLLEEFGSKRIIDTPITEHGFAGIATGASFAGLRPIVEFMTFNFAMQAIDQIINSAAKTLYMSGGQMGAPMVFRGPNGAAARVGAQHSQDYTSWYAHIPGLKVTAPYSASDAKGLLKSAIRDNNPVIFLENEILYGRSFYVPEDITIVSVGIGMQYALKAAEKLAADGIQAEVIDLRTIRPIDYETLIQSVSKTNRCITVEEGFPIASIGNHLSAYIMEHAFDYLDAPVINCSGKDVPMPYAANLEKLALVTTEEVVNAAKKVCYR